MSKKGVIFDFNGTLLWDTQLHNMAWDNFLRKYGLYLSDEDKDKLFHGRLNKEILAELFHNTLTEEETDRLGLEKEYEYRRICMGLKNFSLAEGVTELFDKLREKDIPFVIATASGLENVDFYFETLKLGKWFKREHVIYNDGTIRGKPFPDLFLRAISVLRMDAPDVVIFEDSLSGIKAAEASGAGRIIIVNSNNSDYGTFEGKYPIIRHFSEMEWEWFE